MCSIFIERNKTVCIISRQKSVKCSREYFANQFVNASKKHRKIRITEKKISATTRLARHLQKQQLLGIADQLSNYQKRKPRQFYYNRIGCYLKRIEKKRLEN